MAAYFSASALSAGYNGRALIKDINFELEKGRILTLIGPNGAGKSTILKTISRQLPAISGNVSIGGKDIFALPQKELAKKLALMLTDRVRPELVSCAEVVSMGRYPYTDMFGRLTPKDRAAVKEALKMVNAEELAEQDFATLSDGQRQRVLLARAICQEPELLILDEPTAYLDIRHKIELLDMLGDMARENGISVIMSLHEIDLAVKVSDHLLCVKDDSAVFRDADELLAERSIETLYGIEKGSYNLLFGSVELGRPQGVPEIFVIGGAGSGIGVYRKLQKLRRPFAAGILFKNDVDYQVAKELASELITAEAFEPVSEEVFAQAAEAMKRCRAVINAAEKNGRLCEANARLLELAKASGIPVMKDIKEGTWNAQYPG